MRPTTAVSDRRLDERRGGGYVASEVLIRDADRMLKSCGVERSGGWINRAVRDYQRTVIHGVTFAQFLVNRIELNAQQRAIIAANDDLRYLLEYADPTGETAIRNVARAQRRAS